MNNEVIHYLKDVKVGQNSGLKIHHEGVKGA